MAAIIEPRRLPAHPQQRPALRLVTTDGGHLVDAPMDLGLTPLHLAAAIAAVVVAMVLALAIGNGALAGLAPGPAPASAAAPSAVDAAGSTETVIVHAGDTMWSIARRLQPTGDVRPLVDELVRLNGGVMVQVGQQVVIPA